MMAVFPMATTGTTEKQDTTKLSLEKQTLPGGCNCGYENCTHMGKAMMTQAWDNSHKDGSLLCTSVERCVDFLAPSFLCCFPSDFTTQQTLEFPTDPTKCILTFA